MNVNNVTYKIILYGLYALYVKQTKRKLKTRLNKHVKNIRLDPQKHLSRIIFPIIQWTGKMLQF